MTLLDAAAEMQYQDKEFTTTAISPASYTDADGTAGKNQVFLKKQKFGSGNILAEGVNTDVPDGTTCSRHRYDKRTKLKKKKNPFGSNHLTCKTKKHTSMREKQTDRQTQQRLNTHTQ